MRSLNEYRTLVLSHIYLKAVRFRTPRHGSDEFLSVAENGVRGKANSLDLADTATGEYPEAVTYGGSR